MEKEDTTTVDTKDFKKNQHIFDYIGDDLAIANSLDGIPYSNDTVRLNCFFIAVCAKGHIQLGINYRAYQSQVGDLLLGFPNTLISRMMLSLKYKIRLAGFSTRFLQRIIKMEKKTWNTAAHIHNNPVRSISEGGDDPVFRFYRDLIAVKVNGEPHYCYREVMQHLFSALFREMLEQLHREIDAPDKGGSPKEDIKQADHTLRRLAELLPKDKGMYCSVSCHADVLCCIPKHFSKVVKQTCGRAPLGLISGTTIGHIKYRLKRPDKSVKEIAEEFNFPNQSLFGKYVKMHLGISPANYQNREDGRDEESLEKPSGSVR